MDINNFIKNFGSILEETDTSKLTEYTRFHEEIEEWSSLTALSVIAMIDAEYGVSIKGEEIKKSVTIEDLFNLVRSRK
jgi:acyl carrier protein